MAKTNEVGKELSKTDNGSSDLRTLIEKSAKELGRALPEHLRSDRLVRIALTCVRQNPELGRCTPESFLGALFTAAQLGIEPVGGRAYLLPFRNSRKKPDGSWHSVLEAQFVLGYKGLAEMFYRHDKSVQLEWGIVHQNDEFDFEKGTSSYLKHKPILTNRGEPIAYYVVASLNNGGKVFEIMSREDCLAHGRKHSKTIDKKTGEFYAASPWSTSPDSMCLKTVLVQLCKVLPLSVELQKAIQVDESSRDYRHGVKDVVDVPSTTNWVDIPADAPVVEDEGTAQEPE